MNPDSQSRSSGRRRSFGFDETLVTWGNDTTYMDSRLRKILEVAFECFETAGISLDQTSGSDTGYRCDWLSMPTKDPEYLDRFSETGMGATILGGAKWPRTEYKGSKHGRKYNFFSLVVHPTHGMHCS